jgi:hypothetical protein
MLHQNRNDKITANYEFEMVQSADLAALRYRSSSCLQAQKNCDIFLLHDIETYLSLRLIQG